MIRAPMAVAAVTAPRSQAGEYARDARWARFAAVVLDAIFFSAITAFVNNVYGVTAVTGGYISASGGYYSTSQTIPAPALVVLGLLYFTVFEAMFGATPGKQLMRVKVVRLDGRPLTLWAVISRNIARLVDILPVAYILGGLLVQVTPRAQRLGDFAAGTSVVYRHRVAEVGATRTSGVRARLALAAVVVVGLLFSLGFDYFGRPPLVIQGLYNEHRLLESDVTAYRLGQPTWGAGTVTYPITFATATKSCKGTMTLQWENFGWQLAGARYDCPPS